MRWSNVPIPEAHIAGIAAGIAGHWVAPISLPLGPTRWLLATLLVVGGVGLAGWAVVSAADVDVERDGDLVTNGAYEVSRNPMYLGWSLAVLGLAVARRSVWLLVGWAVAVRRLDDEIRSEELRLAQRFGDRAADYRARVPRYARLPRR